MQIELDHTIEDWRALVRFVSNRPQRRRVVLRAWIAFAVLAGAMIALYTSAFGLSTSQRILGLAGVSLLWLALARWGRAAAPIPDSWLGAQSCELRDDGIAMTTSTARSLIDW